MNKKFVLLDGTSSSGKSTICNFFKTKNFDCFEIDKYTNICIKQVKKRWINTLKKFKNEYSYKNKNKYFNTLGEETMINRALKSKNNVIIDDIDQFSYIKKFEEKKLIHNLYIINVFANLETLARNIELRRKKGEDARGIIPFSQFANRYIKVDKNDPTKIEKVNRTNFKNLLLKYFKYEFTNETELLNFSNDMFKYMEIFDNNDHYIKLRDNIKYDYLLNTSNKTKQEIFKELKENVFYSKTFFLNNTTSKTRKNYPNKYNKIF